MLTIRYPELLGMVRELTSGLLPLILKDDPIPKLIVKGSKETILTAKVKQGFSVYLAPYSFRDVNSLGFVAAFFDNDVHPITVVGAIMQEYNGEVFRSFLLGDQVDIYFFDELNREMLGYRARLVISDAYRSALSEARFPSLKDIEQRVVLDLVTQWFSLTGPLDDERAISFHFEESLFPEDYVFFDMRAENNSYKGSPGYSHTFLEREEPGEFQERDIISLLQNTFPAECIYSSPLRTNDKEEIVDVMVVTESNILFVQAKDSPNLEKTIRKTLERKRLTTHSALKKAMAQVRGTIGYMRRASPMVVLVDGEEESINYEGKNVYSLIVVKELFDDEFDEYTPKLLDVSHDTGAPCIALSYSELYQYTAHLRGDEAFFGAFLRVFDHGVRTGMFPRLRLHHPE